MERRLEQMEMEMEKQRYKVYYEQLPLLKRRPGDNFQEKNWKEDQKDCSKKKQEKGQIGTVAVFGFAADTVALVAEMEMAVASVAVVAAACLGCKIEA